MEFVSEIRSGKGKRTNNQDRFIEKSFGPGKQLYIVCDGMGGHCHGDKAAQLAIRTFDLFISMNSAEKSQSFFEKHLRGVEQTFSVFIEEHQDFLGMGTTLALLYIDGDNGHIFWVGDSRVYHIRKREILFQTLDQNLGTLHVMNGLISPDSIEYHYQRNVLLNCITGSQNPTDSDYKKIEEIKKGDVFFLCSDGVTEALSDSEIIEILTSYPIAKAAYILDQECLIRSEDNYTFIIAQKVS
jgi:PPM family protein phosphatase